MAGRPPHIRDEDLLDAARDVLKEQGFGITTAEIARRAGVSEGSLFHRFHSKDELIFALITRESRVPELLRAVPERAGTATVSENLRQIVAMVLESVRRAHPFFEYLEASPSSFRVFARLRQETTPPPKEIMGLISAYLEAEARLGRVPPASCLAVGHVVVGACVNRVRFDCSTPQEGSDAEFVAALAELISAGLTLNSRP